MVNSVRDACRCGGDGSCCVEDCGGGGGSGGSSGRVAQLSWQRRAERTTATATAPSLLHSHSCTNNSHPDIYIELHQQQKSEVRDSAGPADSVGECEGGRVREASSVPSECVEGGGRVREWRRHSAAAAGEATDDPLARHVWSHRRIARSLSREGFFPTPNEHHPALLRPLAALGDLSTAYPDLPGRLQHLTQLLTSGRSTVRVSREEPTVLSPADTALLTTVARLHLRQNGQAPPLRRSLLTVPAAAVSAPASPDSLLTSRWASLLSLNTSSELDRTSTTTTSEWPSRASSLVSVASSLPDDESSASSAAEEEEAGDDDSMAGGDLVAPQPHYDHHAYHIYYGKPTLSLGTVGTGGVHAPRPCRAVRPMSNTVSGVVVGV